MIWARKDTLKLHQAAYLSTIGGIPLKRLDPISSTWPTQAAMEDTLKQLPELLCFA